MTENLSLALSCRFKALITKDLSHVFEMLLPIKQLEEKASVLQPQGRERIFSAPHTILTMLLSSIQEDKSLQQALNLFKSIFEARCTETVQAEKESMLQEKEQDSQISKKMGRPKKYQSRMPKRYQSSLSTSTAGYATARKNLPAALVQLVYEHSTDFGQWDKERWHGMQTYITDGTYLQLQDTASIKNKYTVKGMEQSYPQALLQVMIRQGSGQVSDFAIATRQQSELNIVIPMIKKLPVNTLLLADDLYNSYYHFCLINAQQCHVIVPGKRDRNYEVIRDIAPNDQIVRIAKTPCPDYVAKEEWKQLPATVLLRRISYTYPTQNGMEAAVLYTTVLDETIAATDIITKYSLRWDVEISIREIKTLMDINVLRSKSPDMLHKELVIALTAYNLVRKIIAQSADVVGFSPQEDIFQKCASVGRSVLLDKKGRVYFKCSPERYGYASTANRPASRSPPKGKTTGIIIELSNMVNTKSINENKIAILVPLSCDRGLRKNSLWIGHRLFLYGGQILFRCRRG
jgi:hypothetical protein